MRKNCNHHTLYFGSGSYYIFCNDCGQSWTTDDANEGYKTLSGFCRYSGTAIHTGWLKSLGLYETAEFIHWRLA